MIRASDLTGTAVWTRATASSSRVEERDASSWFDDTAAEARIGGDVNVAVRGLSVEQHASLVLAHLCDAA